MGVPINNVTRRVVYAASGTGPYAFTFEILANTDIAVYRDDTLLTLTTDYTVSINANGTGSVTLTASPTGATQIAIVGNRSIQRLSDFVTGGDLFANTINDELDQQTIFNQQNAEGLQRALQAPQTDPTSINMILPRASVRAGKVLSFDSNGNPSATEFIGSNRGNWAAGVTYYVRDLVKDTSNNNIYQCLVTHTSSGSQPIASNVDVAKWSALVDAAAAAASAAAAAASASAASTSASNASTSASNAASSASAASSSASSAATQASNASTSASNAASSASTASTQATNAASSASAAATSATNASNSASSASTQATNAANSATAAASSATAASNSATNAASSASAASTSASNAASSASTASTQASNAATSASNAASSATAAASSATAAAASYDSFDDRYLGAKTSNPTVDNDGNALITGAIYFNSVANEMRVWTGSAWQAQAASPDTITERSFTATAGQTSYTFSGGYRVGYTYVWVNGALLDAADITATDGTTITFASALALNDEVRILTFKAIGSVVIADITGLQTALDGKVAGAAATTTVGGDLKLYEGTTNGTNYTAFKAPNSLAANVTWTLPSADGTNGQALTTNGSGTLSWATAGGASAATPTALGTVYGLTQDASGTANTVLGYQGLNANTTGNSNVAIGVRALFTNTTSSRLTAVGYNTMYSNTTGIENSGFGTYALLNNTTGSANTAIGYDSLRANTTASNNTAVGYQALTSATTSPQNVAVGYQALVNATTGSGGNAAVGHQALLSNSTGAFNVAVGISTMRLNTTGASNSALGTTALFSNTTGNYNVAVGESALESNTTASNNTAVGYQALKANTTGYSNAAVGRGALSANTTGYGTTAIGSYALEAQTTGFYNTAVGLVAGDKLTTGAYNVIIGAEAARSAGSNLTTGQYNTIIGCYSGTSASNGQKQIVIGYNVAGQADANVTIGSSVGKIYNAFESNATWTQTSDGTMKNVIGPDTLGLSFINRLNPIKFTWKAQNELPADHPYYNEVNSKDTTTVIHGFVAQEVKAALDAEGCTTFNGWDQGPDGIQAISREMFISPLVKAVQELSAQVEQLKAEIATLKGA